MILIDLSRDIEHKMAVLPNHPQVIVSPFATHEEVRIADGYGFSSATMALVLGDHAGTHVDAPKHFNADPNAMPIDQPPIPPFTASYAPDDRVIEVPVGVGEVDDLVGGSRLGTPAPTLKDDSVAKQRKLAKLK